MGRFVEQVGRFFRENLLGMIAFGLALGVGGNFLTKYLENSPKDAPRPQVPAAGETAPGVPQPPVTQRPIPAPADTARPAYAKYLDTTALAGRERVTLVVTKGHPGAAGDVVSSIGGALQRGMREAAFVKDGLFDRAIRGDQQAIAGLKLPAQIDKLVLIDIGEPNRSTLPDSQGATKVTETVHVVIVEARTGAIVSNTRIFVEGTGFSEQYVQDALREDRARKLSAVRQLL
jgi:hypothetical protein